MTISILMPALSPTMKSGIIVKWVKNEGEYVEPGNVIAEIETDKAVIEMEASDAGVLGKILVPAKSRMVKVNEVIALLLEKGEKELDFTTCVADGVTDTVQHSTNHEESQHSGRCTTSIGCIKPKREEGDMQDSEEHNHADEVNLGDIRIKITPIAKRIAIQHNIDISQIQGSGPHSRITRADIEEFLHMQQCQHSEKKTVDKNETQYGVNLAKSPRKNCGDAKNKQPVLIPLSLMRKVIGQRLQESKQNIPHFYLDISVNVGMLMQLREELNSQISMHSQHQETHGILQSEACVKQTHSGSVTVADTALEHRVKISVNDLIMKAVALALRATPAANIALDGDDIVQFTDVDICFAVSLNGGLITPVIRNADKKTVMELSKEAKILSARAKSGKLHFDEYSGGSITVSNLGMYGIDTFHAIINPPQAFIVSVGAIKKEPIVVAGSIHPCDMMRISISADHRIIDGVLAAQYLCVLRNYIENPLLLLI